MCGCVRACARALIAALLILPQHLTVRVALSLPTLWRRNNRTGTVEDGGARAEELRFCFVFGFYFLKKSIVGRSLC